MYEIRNQKLPEEIPEENKYLSHITVIKHDNVEDKKLLSVLNSIN